MYKVKSVTIGLAVLFGGILAFTAGCAGHNNSSGSTVATTPNATCSQYYPTSYSQSYNNECCYPGSTNNCTVMPTTAGTACNPSIPNSCTYLGGTYSGVPGYGGYGGYGYTGTIPTYPYSGYTSPGYSYPYYYAPTSYYPAPSAGVSAGLYIGL